MPIFGTVVAEERFKHRPDADFWKSNADGLATFTAFEWLHESVIKSSFVGAKTEVLARFNKGIVAAEKREAAARANPAGIRPINARAV